MVAWENICDSVLWENPCESERGVREDSYGCVFNPMLVV